MSTVKYQPQAIDLEKIVLGSILLERTAMLKAATLVSMDTFYKTAHGVIYNAMYTLFNASEPIDNMTVIQQLKKQGKLEEAGGLMYLIDLTKEVSSAANIESHCKILQQKYIQREVIRISSDAIKNAYEDEVDVFELLGTTTNDLIEISNTLTGKKSSLVYDVSQRIAN